MKKLILALTLLAGCGPRPLHLAVRESGQDLGPLVEWSVGKASSLTEAGVVDWLRPQPLYYEGPDCSGAPHLVPSEAVLPFGAYDARPNPRGQLVRPMCGQRELVTIVPLSYLTDYGFGPVCTSKAPEPTGACPAKEIGQGRWYEQHLLMVVP